MDKNAFMMGYMTNLEKLAYHPPSGTMKSTFKGYGEDYGKGQALAQEDEYAPKKGEMGSDKNWRRQNILDPHNILGKNEPRPVEGKDIYNTGLVQSTRDFSRGAKEPARLTGEQPVTKFSPGDTVPGSRTGIKFGGGEWVKGQHGYVKINAPKTPQVAETPPAGGQQLTAVPQPLPEGGEQLDWRGPFKADKFNALDYSAPGVSRAIGENPPPSNLAAANTPPQTPPPAQPEAPLQAGNKDLAQARAMESQRKAMGQYGQWGSEKPSGFEMVPEPLGPPPSKWSLLGLPRMAPVMPVPVVRAPSGDQEVSTMG